MKIKLSKAAILLALVCIVIGCKESFDKMLSNKPYVDAANINVIQQKILYIIVDGARGTSVRDAQAPNITALTPKSTYSWVSLSDELYNDASSWTDMLTGVAKEKHNVFNASFTGNRLDKYPTVITRIKTARPKTRISSFSASPVFEDKLAVGADVRASFGTDAEVKSAVVTELGVDSAAVVIGEFGDVDKAGATSGYDNSFPAYKNAILQFDSYLGDMLTALKSRPTYAKENWLIIVTSSRGGSFAVTPTDGTIFSNAQVNTFTIFANANYVLKFIDKPYTGNRYDGNFVELKGTDNTAVRAQIQDSVVNRDIFNFTDTTQFTLELKVKKINHGTPIVPNYSYSSPALLSKKASNANSSGLGWAISLEATSWQIAFGKVGATNQIVTGSAINDGNWHTLGVVVLNRDFHRYVRTFTDGVFVTEVMLPDNWGPIDYPPTDPTYNNLTLGFIPDRNTNTFDGYISDVRIWLTPIPDATIATYSCDTYVTSAHPNYKRLAGYWPCTDASGTIFKDNSATRANFTILQGSTPLTSPLWVFDTSLTCPVSASNLATMVPNTKDIATQILSWMAIPPSESWNLDGRVWLNQ